MEHAKYGMCHSQSGKAVGIVDGKELFSPSSRSEELLETSQAGEEGRVKTLLGRIIANFPVAPGKKDCDTSWTTEALREVDPTLPLPSAISGEDVHGLPTLLYKIASTLGRDASPEVREKDMARLVRKAGLKKDSAEDREKFRYILYKSACFYEDAFHKFHGKKQPGFDTTYRIIAAATFCMILAFRKLWGCVPIFSRSQHAFSPFEDSMTDRDAISKIQIIITEVLLKEFADLHELRTLIFGECNEDEKDDKKIMVLSGASILESTVLGLSTPPERRKNAALSDCYKHRKLHVARDPLDELETIFLEGFLSSENLCRSLFGDLSFLPSPGECRKEILEHARYTLWPGVNEIYWKEGPLRRVRLFPLESGRVKAAVEIETEDAIYIILRDIPSMRDGEEWQMLIQNDSEDVSLRYRDPMCAAIEALRVCLVAKDRKIASVLGGIQRVPAGFVQGARKPRAGDVVMRYVPRYAPLGGEKTERSGKVSNFSFKRKYAPCAVVGHLRQIPMTHKASKEAKAAAAAAGIPLPRNGHTFVRSHTRGSKAPVPLVRMRKSA